MNAILRPWRAEDADELAEIYAGADADLSGNIPDDRSNDGARAWIEHIHRAEAAGTSCAFALVIDDGGRIVGNVMASGTERRQSSAWVSYWTAADARGARLHSASIGSSGATARTTPPRRRWRSTRASSSKVVSGRRCSTTASASTPRSAPGSALTRAPRARAIGGTEEGEDARWRAGSR